MTKVIYTRTEAIAHAAAWEAANPGDSRDSGSIWEDILEADRAAGRKVDDVEGEEWWANPHWNPVTREVTVQELSIGSVVRVQLGNPEDTYGYRPSQEVKVIRIHKTRSGWSFLGEWVQEDGTVRLYQCCVNHYEGEATALYLSLNGRVVGSTGAETRAEGIASLGFSPD